MRTKLFVLIMLASIVLSACGGGQAQAPAAPEAPAEAPAVEEPTAPADEPMEEPAMAPGSMMRSTLLLKQPMKA